MTDLNEVKTSAEKVLAGSESGEAQEQARNVLGIVGLVADAETKYKDLASSINGELAQLKAEAGDLLAQKARTHEAEAKAKKSEAAAKHAVKALADLKYKHEQLQAAWKMVEDALAKAGVAK